MPNFIVRFIEQLGMPAALVQALVLPLLAALLLWGMRRLFLWLIAKRYHRPQDMRRWRHITIYVVLVAAGLTFRGIWVGSLEQVSIFLAATTQLDAAATLDWLTTSLSVFFSTVALVLAVAVTRTLYHSALVRVRSWTMHGPSFRIQRLELLTRERFRSGLVTVLRFVYYALLITATLMYILFVLNAYPSTARFSGMLLSAFATAAVQVGGAIISYLPNLVYLIIIVITARYALKLLSMIMAAVDRKDITLPNFDPEWAEPTYKLARVMLILFTIMVSYSYLPGAQSEFFQGFSIFVGALVTLGSTAVIGNVISGVVLTYTGSFRVGDRVCIGKTTGDVIEKTLFVTRMRTIENEIVSIPNGVVLTGSVINYERLAKDAGLILTVRVGIGYDIPWKKVHELMLAAAEKTSGVVSFPRPQVWQISLDDFAVIYELRATTNRPARMAKVKSDLNRYILDAFNEAGVEIMTPSVRSVRDGSATAIPAEYDPPQGPIARLRVDLQNAADALRANDDAS
ncbi:MAG: mechanosensitive ion channel [Acidobacteria bacterium]|nr:mechanosensitive ion channel [Acidobacteriota bacterium]MDA1236556.1 mechanosensitive ion channel [Acidobacteriota bacterium]